MALCKHPPVRLEYTKRQRCAPKRHHVTTPKIPCPRNSNQHRQNRAWSQFVRGKTLDGRTDNCSVSSFQFKSFRAVGRKDTVRTLKATQDKVQYGDIESDARDWRKHQIRVSIFKQTGQRSILLFSSFTQIYVFHCECLLFTGGIRRLNLTQKTCRNSDGTR